jgi:hypothetical protein
VVLAASLVAACPGSGAAASLSLLPSTLRVGMFSADASLRVAGRAPAGSDVVVVVRGRDVQEALTREVRVGFLWVAGSKLEVSGAPALFLSFSRRPVSALLPRPAIDDFVLDERALVTRMRVAPREADTAEIREAYLRLKVDDGSYRRVTNGVEVGAAAGGEVPFAVEFAWPPTAPPGSYRASAYECRGGAVVGTSSATFDVVESGFAAWIKDLADNHGAAYGALAVGVTLSVGFGLDSTLAWIRRRRGAGRRRGEKVPARENVGVH